MRWLHGGHVGEEGLGGANVAGGFVAANVLLPGLQCQAVGLVAAGVLGDAHHTAGHCADVDVVAGEEGGVRTAVAQRDTESLTGTDGHVNAHFTRRFQQRQCHQVRRTAYQTLNLNCFN